MEYKILFLCVHNSARSQMAEAFLNKLDGKALIAESAGLEPGTLNPNVVEVMKEIGIDISGNRTKDVFELFKDGKKYDAVVTVCDAHNAERCPVFPGKVKRIAWFYDDPSSFKGTHEEILERTRQVRDAVERDVTAFVKEANDISFWR